MSIMNQHTPDRVAATRSSMKIRRFNGLDQTVSDWDHLKRDPDLWNDDGDCLVYFNSPGASRRGPSLNIPYTTLEESNSPYLMAQCQQTPRSATPPSCAASDSGYESARAPEDPESQQQYLYLPLPSEVSPAQAFDYHLTSRNYFAFIAGRPLVGRTLRSLLSDLWRRLQEWQPDHTSLYHNFTAYCRAQGYLDLSDNPHYATAMLAFAEDARLNSLWIEAFAHCVGMHDRLDINSEYDGLSNTTKALITKASLEMDLHIGRVIRAVGNFLEDELSSDNLGLSKPARDHLDHFRTFLHAHYVEKLGYFPPTNTEVAFDKPLWTSVYDDFSYLYDYLVDTESKNDLLGNRGFIGGVCVYQNVNAFNQRNALEPLPHPLPLLPDLTSLSRLSDTQKTLRNLKLSRSESEPKFSARYLLAKASNSQDPTLLSHSIVQEYIRFEKQRLEEKLSIAEARNVRWILIYCLLQLLGSVTRAPEEVQNPRSSPYPLCVLTAGCPPWTAPVTERRKPLRPTTSHTSLSTPALLAVPIDRKPDSNEDGGDDGASGRLSIHPDCEADNAQDFFSSLSRRQTLTDSHDSDKAFNPQPMQRVNSFPLSRTTSIKTSVHTSMNALHKSVKGSLSRRNTSRKTSHPYPVPRKAPSFCEIVVEGYGNGANGDDSESTLSARLSHESVPTSATTLSNPLADFDFGLGSKSEFKDDGTLELVDGAVPLLEEHQLHDEAFTSLPYIAEAISESLFDTHLDTYSDSHAEETADDTSPRGSSYLSDCDTPITQYSSRSNSTSERMPSNSATPGFDIDQHIDHLVTTPHSYQSSDSASSTLSIASLNVGCYVPSGITTFEAPVSKFAAQPKRMVYERKYLDAAPTLLYGVRKLDGGREGERDGRGRRRSRLVATAAS